MTLAWAKVTQIWPAHLFTVPIQNPAVLAIRKLNLNHKEWEELGTRYHVPFDQVLTLSPVC